MRDDGFAREVDRLLLLHREGQALDPNNMGEMCACDRSYPEWRRHTAELIAAARVRADEKRAKAPRTVSELLELHVPYIRSGSIIQCGACLNGLGGGEFRSTAEWARHLEMELARAGYRITKARR